MQLHQLQLPEDIDADFLASGEFTSDDFVHHLMSAAKVHVQFFRGLPMRVRVRDHRGEHVTEMPKRFQNALAQAMKTSGANVQRESMWSFYGYRHGSLQEAAEVAVCELDFAIDDDQLQDWIDNVTSDREISLVHNVYTVAFLGGAGQETYLA